MLIYLAIAVVGVVAAVVFALVAQRASEPSPVTDSYVVPRQLYREDFPSPNAPWLVALFTSEACDGCAPMRSKVMVLESAAVSVCEISFPAHRNLHDRYAISGVPMVLVADAQGVVLRAFVGPTSATDLWAAVASARDSKADVDPGLGALP
jgi:hypothetical protein